jgi:hypothetical protein
VAADGEQHVDSTEAAVAVAVAVAVEDPPPATHELQSPQYTSYSDMGESK